MKDITLTEGNTLWGKNDVWGINPIKSNNSANMYIELSRDYIEQLLSIKGVTAITFDIILSEFKQLQLNGNNSNFYDAGHYEYSTKTEGGVTYHNVCVFNSNKA